MGRKIRDRQETYVVVDCVADGATDYPYGKGESRDGGDEIIWADDGCDDGCWDNDSTDSKSADDEYDP